MARAWRIEYEGALYHVLSRGNQRQNIVADDDGRAGRHLVGDLLGDVQEGARDLARLLVAAELQVALRQPHRARVDARPGVDA